MFSRRISIVFALLLIFTSLPFSRAGMAQDNSTEVVRIYDYLKSCGNGKAALAACWESLSTREQELVEADGRNGPTFSGVTVTKIASPMTTNDQDVVQAAAATGCARTTGWHTKNSPSTNTPLYKFFTSMYWCYDGYRVYDIRSLGSWVEVYIPGWEYKAADTWMRLSNFGYAYKDTHAHFAVCFAYCFNHRYPWVELFGYANGTATVNRHE